MMKTVSVSERILELLEAEGIKTLFGIPDPGFVNLFATAEKRGWTVIAPHHEQCGGFMVEGMYRMTGGPGVVIGNEGPGVANLVPAAICAAKEHTPVIFLGGQRSRTLDASIYRGRFQYTPQRRFFEPAVKYLGVIEFADQVDMVFQEAFRAMFTGTPGPVYIEFPEDHVATQIECQPALAPDRYRMVRQAADPEPIAKAAEVIEAARQPILLMGTAVQYARAQQEVAALAKTMKCPVISSWGAAGFVPQLAGQQLIYSTPAANEAIAAADVVVAIGTELGEPLHGGTKNHWASGNADRKWIHIERDPGSIGANRPIDIPLVGDLKQVVPQLNNALADIEFKQPDKLAAWCDQTRNTMAQMADAAPDTSPIHPGRMMVEATRQLPQDTVIVRDGGATALWAVAYNQCPVEDIFWSSNFGHLGTGLGHAIGAQLAVGDKRRVCLITGDSAFQFHITELETAVRKHLPIVIIVNVDHAWGLEEMVYQATFGPDVHPVEARWGRDVRFDKVAEGFGAHGEYVVQTDQVGPAVKRALASGKTAVIHVAVDSAVNATQAPGLEEFSTWYSDRFY